MNNMTGNNNNSNNSNYNHNSNINSSSSPNYSQSSDANSDSKKLAKLKATNLCDDNKTLSGGNKSERCVLCLDDKRYPVRIPCGHSFCKDCLDVYKSYQKYAWANRCPICRGSMKEKRHLVKRKHSETTDGATATTSATAISSSSSQLGPTRMRLNPSSATRAAATVTVTALSEAAAEATVEQIHFLEEYMAMAVELDVFGTNTGTTFPTFGNAVSISTPTNSASTVSASEAAGEDEEAEELHAADLEANWEQNVGYEQEEFGEGDVDVEEDEEALGDDVDVEGDEESDGEDDNEEDGDDEDDDLYFFDDFLTGKFVHS
ncbi:myosin-G heavy chain-like [Rhagoletis pomonella]|uniref:myosin-G heavy chain-like n=1 Tax=Rhagoletis pomonella TaxID=28610 RepID=UPI00177EBCCB|nr:myosin-G heavy chain-like [Rhagoletis pomonella]